MKQILIKRNGYSPYDLNQVSKKFDTTYNFPTNRRELSSGYSAVEFETRFSSPKKDFNKVVLSIKK